MIKNTLSVSENNKASPKVYKCKTVISGEHRYLDNRFFVNMYGSSFFKSGGEYTINPYISPLLSAMPGIYDDFFTESFSFAPASDRIPHYTETQQKITSCVNKKYISVQKPENRFPVCRLSSTYSDGSFFILGNEIMLSYSAGGINTICLTGGDSITATLSFSPFETVSFLKDSRLLQTIEYPLPALCGEQDEKNESFFIETSVTTKKMDLSVTGDSSFSVDIDYFVEIGTAKCEESKIKIEVSALADS